MWINQITLKDFRAFQKPLTINMAKNITCISGHNGIGKSTILAVLSNCGELKKGVGSHINGSSFRGEFSDIIIGDRKFDSSGDKAILKFSDVPKSTPKDIFVPTLEFRATFQKERYRLIPKPIPGIRDTESKLTWPTYYLGLSRLYPVGESKKASKENLPESIEKELIDLHAHILSLSYDDESSMKSIGIQELTKRKTGIRSSNMSETANSAGQDNVGQILLTVMSFRKLKQNSSNYHGGILLIDELDATLHPAAQRKLFDYLYEQSLDLNLQIIFTTHSLSLLEYIALRRSQLKNTTNIKISYLTKRTSSIIERENPTKEFFINDLTDTYTGNVPSVNKVKILTEDNIARWFINQVFDYKHCTFEVDFLDINISWSHIINLVLSDFEVFKNYIVILDPDINKSDNLAALKKMITGYPITIDENLSNIFILPSNSPDYFNIERMMWEYVTQIPDTHDFFNDPIIVERNWQQRLIIMNGVNSKLYNNLEDDMKYKKWFENNRYFIDILMKYWVNDYSEQIDIFLNMFKSTYGKTITQINS